MSYNTATSIHKYADKIMEIIERESSNTADFWKREHEVQKRQIQQLAQDRDVALKEAEKAREEAESYKAEISSLKNDMSSRAQVGQREVQSWKSKYELAVRRQNEVQERLGRTQARFSHTIVPIETLESPISIERNPSALDTPAKPGASSAAGPSFHIGSSSSVYSPTNNARRSATLNTQEPVEFNSSQAKSPFNRLSGETASIRTRFTPLNTSSGEEKCCYCDSHKYGSMITCGSPTCTIQWFHFPCTGLETLPVNDWFCKVCTGAKTPFKHSSNTQNHDIGRP